MPRDPIRRHQKIEARISVRPNGCHEWTGARNVPGYGVIMIDRKRIYVHRYLWERQRGPLPKGHHLHHLCENPPCVNVEHLELLTAAEHISKHPHSSTRLIGRTHCKNGHRVVDGSWKLNAQGRWFCVVCSRDAHQRSYARRRANLS